ncbi:MAG TPA: BTAD domain-containing putative transcriptional regulator, partial [Aggregatilineales bacterium]|nr:BTAD domain-containing putative transcriptional regulator [Aggregatilineales bacterium]
AHDLSEQVPTFGRHLNRLGSDIGSVDPEALLASVVLDLEELTDEPYFLVLDEYDASEKANDVQEFLESLLRNLPPNCQIIINSRTLPRLPWIAMIAQNEAIILSDNHLITNDPYRMESDGVLGELTVNCLGPNSIAKNGQLIESWEGHLPRLLFIFALERPVVTRSEICQAFWPTLDNDQAVNVFHVTKRRLHKALGFDALIHQDGYYQVNPGVRIHYDVTEFVSALLQGRITGGEFRSEAWQRAIELYRGPFLQGHSESWIVQQREAYQRAYLEAIMAIANIRLEENRPEHALRLLTQASGENTDFEPLHREIMKLYARLGRRSEAASHYQSLEETLHERGTAPSPETRRLYDELMS